MNGFFADLLQIIINPLDRSVFAEQTLGGLLPHFGHPGHIIAAVSHQGKVIDHLCRTQAELFHQIGLVDNFGVTSRTHAVHLDHRRKHLHHVFVRRGHKSLHPHPFRPFGQGGDDVVRLIAVQLQLRNLKGLHQLDNLRKLRRHLFRHLLPGSLVRLVHLVAEGRGFGVKYHPEIIRFLLKNDLHQIQRETEYRAGIFSPGIDQRIADEGKIGAVVESRSIN